MPIRSATALALALASSLAAAAPSEEAQPSQIQFAFYRFENDRVRVTVDGRTAFDRVLSVAPDNVRSGLAAVAQIRLPTCAEIAVTTGRERVAERLCLTATTRSVVIDAGPPLTIAAKDRFMGED